MERESNDTQPFLDMQLLHQGNQASFTWYSKPNDAGFILNYHGLALKRYKRAVVPGVVHRIYRE